MAQINLPLDFDYLEVIDQSTDKNGKTHERVTQHLEIFDTPVYLRIKPVSYSCKNCDDRPMTTEQYDWCD